MNIYFVGIGGIGVSALAKFYFFNGHQVSGSDLNKSEITGDLEKLGIKIYIGHQKENLPENTDLLILSGAVPENNPEFLAAKKLGIKKQTYAQALGGLTKKYFTIAVSGIHGKSTTTAMIALILEKAGLDPTVIVGTKLKEWKNSNFRQGKSKYLVVEADEYKANFLNYWPKIIVLTNIEKEHLDYYKNLEHILETFKKYVNHLSRDGSLIINKDDAVLNSKSQFLSLREVSQRERNSKQIPNIFFYSLNQSEGKKLRKTLKVPGDHNISNALAALTTARALKIPDKIIFRALANFRGTWRRFEFRKKYKGAFIFDDYGHHPTEVRATLRAAREFMENKKLNGKLWCVFQPHQIQRLKLLFKDFITAFDGADRIVILDVFKVAGREEEGVGNLPPHPKNTGCGGLAEKLVKKIKKRGKSAIYTATIPEIKQYLKKELRKGDLAILMGAGDIYKLEIK